MLAEAAQCEFTAVITPNQGVELAAADVILPGSHFLETDGTAVNFEGRVQKLNRVLTPPSGKDNLELLTWLGQAVQSRKAKVGSGIGGNPQAVQKK